MGTPLPMVWTHQPAIKPTRLPPSSSNTPIRGNLALSQQSARLHHALLPPRINVSSQSAQAGTPAVAPIPRDRAQPLQPSGRHLLRSCRTGALMGVRESITTVWDATVGRWHGSTIICGRHCVGGGLYKGPIEMVPGIPVLDCSVFCARRTKNGKEKIKCE